MGSLIVFEGVNGTGKTTLSKMLVRHLNSLGHPAEYFSFPGSEKGSLGDVVYQIEHSQHKPLKGEIHPASMQLLHIAAHIDAIENRILPNLRKGIHVILDRYWWSTWAYGVATGVSKSTLNSLIDLEQQFWKGYYPEVAFLLEKALHCCSTRILNPQTVIDEYRQVANRENSKYPVRVISNNEELHIAFAKVCSEISILQNTSTIDIEANADKIQSTTYPISSINTAIWKKLTKEKTTLVFDTYWKFAHERQNIYFNRIARSQWPWTEDPILKTYKFTNAYRASDRASQYLIKNVIYKGDYDLNEVFFRTLLFKLFNRIETWEMLNREFGSISYRDFSLKRYDAVLTSAMKKGVKIYSAAYIMPSGGTNVPSTFKHTMHLHLIHQMMKDHLPKKLSECRCMAHAFDLLRQYPTIGDFLAYQYTIDLNYGPVLDFSEMDFVVPGPGALRGIHKCFSDLCGLSEAEVIRLVVENQDSEFERLGLQFKRLWGRPLQLVDCQNLFCEVDKYSRVAHPEFNQVSKRARIKQKFNPKNSIPDPWYPPKWDLNELIQKERYDS